MLFPRRTWATRVIGKMGLPIKSKEATALIDLLIWASKEDTHLMKDVAGFSLSPGELIVKWACAMHRNQSAKQKFAEKASLDVADAARVLEEMHVAGIGLATEHKMQKLLELEGRKDSATTGNSNSCVSYYLDPRLPEPVKRSLVIGQDIARETYDKFKDAEGNIYIVGVLERGELKLSYVSKPLWDDMLRATKIL
jgi:hypothetical protein